MKKIAIIGPESSGKTTLVTELAVRLRGSQVPEFARSFLEKTGPAYAFEDLRKIAQGQLQLEDDIVSSVISSKGNPVFFLDTELTVIRVWSEVVFNRCDNFILSSIAARQYDHYLLTYPDLEWQPDDLREYPDDQERIRHYHYYLDAMLNQQVPFSIIRGKGEERISQALQALSYLFQ
jgi:NadR type nicotinamide-nucleotide adenylyltransferase